MPHHLEWSPIVPTLKLELGEGVPLELFIFQRCICGEDRIT